MDTKDAIALPNPILRGWANYFRTRYAANKFRQIYDYVMMWLRMLLIMRRDRNHEPDQWLEWTGEWFNGRYRLRGTVRDSRSA